MPLQTFSFHKVRTIRGRSPKFIERLIQDMAHDEITSPLSLDEFCRLMPKAELHCHLLGAIRRDTFLELARRENAIEPAEIDALYAGGVNRKGVIPALRALEARVLRHPDDFYRLTVEYLEDARAHNILYTEFFW